MLGSLETIISRGTFGGVHFLFIQGSPYFSPGSGIVFAPLGRFERDLRSRRDGASGFLLFRVFPGPHLKRVPQPGKPNHTCLTDWEGGDEDQAPCSAQTIVLSTATAKLLASSRQ